MTFQVPGGTGWDYRTLKDAFAPRPPTQYVVEGLFPLGSLNIVYGAPGSLKTMLLLDMAAAVVQGGDWLPPVPGKQEQTARATVQGPVLWLDFDNGGAAMDARVEAVCRARGLTEDAGFYYVSMPSPWFDATNARFMAALDYDARCLKAHLVMIENLCTVSGNADENSAEMAGVMSNLRRMSDHSQAAVVVSHHQRKSTGGKGRAGDSLRGHGSIEAAVDLALLVEREQGASDVVITATKARGMDVPPFGAVFAYTHKPGTTDLAEARFFGMEIQDLSSNAAIRRIIVEVVGQMAGCNKTTLTTQAQAVLDNVGQRRIWEQIDRLVAEGKLVQTAGPHNAKLYWLPRYDPFDKAWL